MTQPSHQWAYTEKTIIEKNTCTPIFTAALFTRVRTWKQPSYLSTDEWIKQLWYIYAMEYYSAKEKKEFESILVRWISLEPVVQSEISQKGKKYKILMHIRGIQKNCTDEPISRTGIETQTQRTDLRTQWGQERMGQLKKCH